MYRTGTALALIMMSAAGAAFGQTPGLEPVLERLRSQGWSNFEVEREDGSIKIEARQGGSERELTYDASTGELLKDEVGPIDDDGASPGAEAPGIAAAIAGAGLGSVYGALRSQGYMVTEVEREAGQIKIEATRDGLQRELTYDASTGALLEDEVYDDDGFDGSDEDDDRGAGRSDDDADDDDDDDRDGGRGGSDDDDDDDDDGGRGGSDDDDDGSGGGRGSDDDDDDDDDNGGGRGSSDDDDDDDNGGGRGSSDDDDNGGSAGGASSDDRGGGSSGGGGGGRGSSDDDDDDDDSDDDSDSDDD
jgi:hypothetical protein